MAETKCLMLRKSHFGLFFDLVPVCVIFCLLAQTADINVHIKDTGKKSTHFKTKISLAFFCPFVACVQLSLAEPRYLLSLILLSLPLRQGEECPVVLQLCHAL